MRLIYPDVADCAALVIDPNPTSRSIQAAMLRQMGVGHIVQTSRIADARRALENRVFDIVLCDYHFDNSPMSGQDLLDDLRRSQLLPYSTVFVMVTGEASYTHVAEAAEAALDSYLLKPHTAAALEQRLLQARHRKQVLRGIFEAIESADFETAAALCRQRFEARAEYWLYAARIGAELCLRLNDHAAARAMYEAVQQTQALPWAKLGIARSEIESGKLAQATRTLESLISDHPQHADAYDVMGRVQLEQGDLMAAVETYRSAVKITPQSTARLQKLGMLAFFAGDAKEALLSLERAVRIGFGSKTFDPQSLVLLALMQHDARDGKAFGRSCDNLASLADRQPGNARLQRFSALLRVFQCLQRRQVGECVAQVRDLADGIRAEDFDFEAAGNMLAMLARLHSTEIQLAEAETWIAAIARRFCVSKASTDLLCMAVQACPAYTELVRDGHVSISGMAERAMAHSVSGAPEAAVQSLLSSGGETLNAKLIDLAGLVLNRHAARIADSTGLSTMLGELKRRYCSRGAQIALGSSAGRAAGGLTLRT